MQINRSELIKERLTMPEVLQRYGFEPKKRMCCPLHNGKDKNFSVMEKGYMCFSQCGGGDVITFVQKLFGLSFTDTLKKIDTDFGLNLYDNMAYEDLRRMRYQSMQLKAKQEREKAEKQHAEDEYWKVFDEWKRLDDNKRLYAPKTPDEEWHPLFVEALQKLSYREYLLDEAEERRLQFE